MANPLQSDIIDLEHQVWKALMRGDVHADNALLSDDFLGVYPTGFSDRQGHSGQLSSGPSIVHYSLSEFHMLIPGPGLALLCYRAEYQRCAENSQDQPAQTMMVSSLWREGPNGWLNIFSQDTPIEQARE